MNLELEKLEYNRDGGTWTGDFTVRDSEDRELFTLRESTSGGTHGHSDRGYAQQVEAPEAMEKLFKRVREKISNVASSI